MRRLILAVLILVGAAAPASAGIVARVDISSQSLRIYEDGRLAYAWRVSTARKGYRTPVGSYRPTRMHRMWYSRKYDNSPMPHSIFFHGGYAIHGTDAVRSLGRPASHGCIRLHPGNAKRLYNLVKAHGAGNTLIVVRR
jgi:lipoprotein-anchoring transpeptidase ErfK/SrfK